MPPSASLTSSRNSFAGHRRVARRGRGRAFAPSARKYAQSLRTRQRSQSGFGRQTRRPWRISASEARVHALRRQQRAQRCSDRHRIVGVHEADAIGDAQHVAIDREAGHVERMTEHDVGGLATDAGQLRRARPSRPAPRRRDRPRARAPCRSAIGTSCGRNLSTWICGSSSSGVAFASARGVRVPREERRRHLVHARVGALRGQDRRDEQLERRCGSRARSSRSDAAGRADRRCSRPSARDGRVMCRAERVGHRGLRNRGLLWPTAYCPMHAQ